MPDNYTITADQLHRLLTVTGSLIRKYHLDKPVDYLQEAEELLAVIREIQETVDT